MHLLCTSMKDVSAKGHFSYTHSTHSVVSYILWQHPVTLMVTQKVLKSMIKCMS